MHQKPCPDMLSGESNVVKFCKKPESENLKNPQVSQFEVVKAIYDSGLLSEYGLSGSAKLVLIALAHHYNPNKKDMFPSQKFLSKQLGISERSAERAVAELKTANLITYETQKVNHYRFTEKFFISAKMSDAPRQNVGQKPRQNVGQTNKHEQKKNVNSSNNFYSNQPKGMEYVPFEPIDRVRDERTPENDFETAKNFVNELLPLAQNSLIASKIQKVKDIWGPENF